MNSGAILGHGKLWNGQQGQYFTKTFTRTKGSETSQKYSGYKNNRYTVRNLWKENQPSLPFNKPLALSRISSLEEKFEQNPPSQNVSEILPLCSGIMMVLSNK